MVDSKKCSNVLAKISLKKKKRKKERKKQTNKNTPQYQHSQINIEECQSQISICGVPTLAVVV